MSDYLSQSAVLRSGLSQRAQKALEERLGGKPIEQVFMGQRKYDGVSGIVHTGRTLHSNGEVTSRVGTELVSCEHILRDCQAVFGDGVVLFGELWMPNVEQSTINGHVMRHEPSPQLQFVIFDVVPESAFQIGHSIAPYHERYSALLVDSQYYNGRNFFICPTYNPGTYGSLAEFTRHWLEVGGYDGSILRDPAGLWIAGKDKAGVVIKDKQVLEFDLEIIGTEMGKGRNANRIGAYVCRFKDGKPLKVSGMSDEERNADPATVIGKIIEVHCTGLSSQGSLREPRYKGFRHDKYEADF